MGLNNYEPAIRFTFVSISKGKLYTKLKDREPIFYNDLDAYITKVEFRDDEYNGKKFELAKFTMYDNGEYYVLQIRTDSGYFRGLCNSIRTGNPKEKFNIIPNYKEENGKPKTTCFVKQNGKILKHAFTMSNMGDFPPIEVVIFKGQETYDSSKQIIYWKKWLSDVEWHNPNEKLDVLATIKETKPEEKSKELPTSLFEDDDLPF